MTHGRPSVMEALDHVLAPCVMTLLYNIDLFVCPCVSVLSKQGSMNLGELNQAEPNPRSNDTLKKFSPMLKSSSAWNRTLDPKDTSKKFSSARKSSSAWTRTLDPMIRSKSSAPH